jgi:hypothetical protein
MSIVKAFARILLEVNAFDPHDDAAAVFEIDGNLAFANNGRFVLADLVALRQVGIEIILSVENRSRFTFAWSSPLRIAARIPR